MLQLSTSLIVRPVDDLAQLMMDPQGDCTGQLRHQLLRVSLGRCQTKRGQEEEEEQGVSEEEGEEEEEVMLVWEVPSNSSLEMMVCPRG
jgi:hypothetical protein